ncbi:MAG: hypothetical protein ACKVQQ_23725 [Burkholderiales bacterium]
MPKAARPSEPLVHPPLSPELKARLRKAGHGHVVKAVEGIKADTIRGLMKAMASGPVFNAKVARKAA